MFRVVVLADTHLSTEGRPRGRLPDIAWPLLKRADLLLHAGDVLDAGVLAMFGEVAPLYAVLGNNDVSLVGVLPPTRVVEVEGVTIGMVHDSGPTAGRSTRMHRKFPEADAVVFGHSHVPMNEIGEAGQVLFNPGSAVQRRSAPVRSLGELYLADGQVVRRRVVGLD